jgi:hypothetical protein
MEAAAYILIMESKGFFETSICLHQNTRLHIPNFNKLFTHRLGELKSRISVLSSHERQIFQVVSWLEVINFYLSIFATCSQRSIVFDHYKN